MKKYLRITVYKCDKDGEKVLLFNSSSKRAIKAKFNYLTDKSGPFYCIVRYHPKLNDVMNHFEFTNYKDFRQKLDECTEPELLTEIWNSEW